MPMVVTHGGYVHTCMFRLPFCRKQQHRVLDRTAILVLRSKNNICVFTIVSGGQLKDLKKRRKPTRHHSKTMHAWRAESLV